MIIQGQAQFEPSLRQTTYGLLEEYSTRVSEHDREQLWAVLRREVDRHKRFKTAKWALPEQDIERLQQIVERLQPDNVVRRVAWLFDDHYPTIPSESPGGPIADVDQARSQAIRDVLRLKGPDGLVMLAGIVRLPQTVAIAAVPELDAMSTFHRLIDATLGRGERLDTFVCAVSGGALRKFGEPWTIELVAKAAGGHWRPADVATLLLGWPNEPSTWELVTQLGREVEESYWRRRIAFPMRGDLETIETAARKYFAVGRALAALDAVHDHVSRLPLSLVFELLDAAVQEINASGKPQHNLFVHNLGEMFGQLAARPDAPLIDVARREYVYLPLLGPWERQGHLAIHQLMAQDPAFFVEILSDVFRAKSASVTEPTKKQKTRAHLSYNLLRSFQTVPGASEGSIDAATLEAWIDDVRRIAADVDRTEIADQHIGYLLAHVAADPRDGAWPNRAVRELLERLESAEVERGIAVERFNMRGVVSKAMFEGGRQERLLAAEARGWARAATAWSRTARVLQEIAASWERYAEQEDERARQDQMRLE